MKGELEGLIERWRDEGKEESESPGEKNTEPEKE